MAGFNANYGYNYNYGYNPYQAPQPQQQAVRYPQQVFDPQYVTGIEGANAFQLPPGVQQMILWDTDADCFYIKKLDEMGRPKVVAWKDFHDHVEPIAQQPQQHVASEIDMSVYPTKQDLEDMLDKYDMTKYITKEDFANMLSHLCVGERGRIVFDEHNS